MRAAGARRARGEGRDVDDGALAPRAIHRRAGAWQVSMMPRTLTAKTLSHSSTHLDQRRVREVCRGVDEHVELAERRVRLVHHALDSTRRRARRRRCRPPAAASASPCSVDARASQVGDRHARALALQARRRWRLPRRPAPPVTMAIDFRAARGAPGVACGLCFETARNASLLSMRCFFLSARQPHPEERAPRRARLKDGAAHASLAFAPSSARQPAIAAFASRSASADAVARAHHADVEEQRCGAIRFQVGECAAGCSAGRCLRQTPGPGRSGRQSCSRRGTRCARDTLIRGRCAMADSSPSAPRRCCG